MEKPKKQIQKPIWQKADLVPDVALGWNERNLVMREEKSIFENETLIGAGTGGKDSNWITVFVCHLFRFELKIEKMGHKDIRPIHIVLNPPKMPIFPLKTWF